MKITSQLNQLDNKTKASIIAGLSVFMMLFTEENFPQLHLREILIGVLIGIEVKSILSRKFPRQDD